jgi:hypothetical protein
LEGELISQLIFGKCDASPITNGIECYWELYRTVHRRMRNLFAKPGKRKTLHAAVVTLNILILKKGKSGRVMGSKKMNVESFSDLLLPTFS